MGDLDLVRVVAVHPEANAVDVVSVRTGARVAGVQVLGGMAGADHGESGLMEPAEQAQAKPFDAPLDPTRVIYGVLARAGGMPILLGFLHPQVSQTLFAEKNRFVWRHPSDLYATVRDNADLELAHPSGTFIRIAATSAHEDLTGRDYDARWKIARNTAAAPWLSVAIANAGAAPHTTLTIDPSGNVSFYNAGNVTWHTVGNITAQIDGSLSATVNQNLTALVKGNAQATVNGTADLHVKGNLSVEADANLALTVAGTITSSASVWNHTGPVNIAGNLGVAGNIAGTAGGSGGGSATFSGNVTATGTVTGQTDVIAAGISGKGHHHGGVQTGGGVSAGPQ